MEPHTPVLHSRKQVLLPDNEVPSIVRQIHSLCLCRLFCSTIALQEPACVHKPPSLFRDTRAPSCTAQAIRTHPSHRWSLHTNRRNAPRHFLVHASPHEDPHVPPQVFHCQKHSD